LTYAREELHVYTNDNSVKSIEIGLKSAVRAIQLDPKIPQAYLAIGLLNLAMEEYDNALAAARHAIKLDQNYADGYALLAEIAVYGGDLKVGLAAIQRAKLLHPRHPPSYHWVEGHILYLLEEYDLVQTSLEHATRLGSKLLQVFTTLAATYAQQGDLERATGMLVQAQSINQDINPIELIEKSNYKISKRRESLLDGLRKVPTS